MKIPLYNEDKATRSGLYLGLFHGRNAPDEQMDEWGFNGPLIGPLEYVHTTYQEIVRIEFADLDTFKVYQAELGLEGGPETEFSIREGCLLCSGKYYGDWSVFYAEVK